MRSNPSIPLAAGLILLALVLAGCNFESDIDPLEIPDAPPPQEFGELGAVEGPAPVEPSEGEELPIEPVEVVPELQTLCTTVYLNIRSEPNLDEEEPIYVPPGTEVSWTGEETVANGHLWYRVSVSEEVQGWSASQYLSEGSCGSGNVFSRTDFGLIEASNTDYLYGNKWLDPDAEIEHFGVDVVSDTGNPVISSPYTDRIVVRDSCPNCTAADPEEGNTYGDSGRKYNYGYGAMVVVEYAYSDLSNQERSSLENDGITIREGQSLYLMVAHLNPNADIAQAGSALAAGSQIASIGNSGYSGGAHAHLEVAVNASGLSPSDGEGTADFWLDTVVDQDYRDPDPAERQGKRLDPTGLFD